jgi:hypothetical protein
MPQRSVGHIRLTSARGRLRSEMRRSPPDLSLAVLMGSVQDRCPADLRPYRAGTSRGGFPARTSRAIRPQRDAAVRPLMPHRRAPGRTGFRQQRLHGHRGLMMSVRPGTDVESGAPAISRRRTPQPLWANRRHRRNRRRRTRRSGRSQRRSRPEARSRPPIDGGPRIQIASAIHPM